MAQLMFKATSTEVSPRWVHWKKPGPLMGAEQGWGGHAAAGPSRSGTSKGRTGPEADLSSDGPAPAGDLAGLAAAMIMFCSALSMCRRSATDLRPSPVAALYSAHARCTTPVDSRQVISADANVVVASSLRFNSSRSRAVDSSTSCFTQPLWAFDSFMLLLPESSRLHPVFRPRGANL